MPTIRESMGLVSVSGKIYAIGGGAIHGNSDAAEAYDPVSNTWSHLSPMPVPTDAPAVAAVGSIIYVMGGINPTKSTAAVWAYDTMHDTWTRKSDMPALLPDAGVGYAASPVTINDKIYVAPRNTWHPIGPGNISLVYDATTDSWNDSWNGPPFHNSAGLTMSLSDYGMTDYGTKIFVLGGLDANQVTNAEAFNFAYDTVTGNWTRGADIPTPRTGPIAVTANNVVYVIGGGGVAACHSGSCNVNEAYTPNGTSSSPISPPVTPPANPGGTSTVHSGNAGINWSIIGIVALPIIATVAAGTVLFSRHRSGHLGPDKAKSQE
jgi:kelch-like protein 8